MGLFGKKNEKELSSVKPGGDGIVILSSTEKGMCGGRDASLDTKAPKTIGSGEMVLFDVTSVLPSAGETDRIGFVSAFAIPSEGGGTFLLLEKGAGFRRRGERAIEKALVKEDVMPSLDALARDCDLAKQNGYHSETHGLPENFGGSVFVLYASGEKISFSDNQSPILSARTGEKIVSLFEKAMRKEKIALPDADDLAGIEFFEDRKRNGFTSASLTLKDDGTGINRKSARYEDPRVYESEKQVDAETVAAIKKTIADCDLFAWEKLPDAEYDFGKNKKLTFLFKNGTQITVTGGKRVPRQISRGFFEIELELATKN